ncbi:MAG: hypothetical protein C0475_05785 [Planctomyces sp.]|nr:hypothetical protein [Planctomyces sp.]MBA4119958.1 hypothetical protein [Isosphaera sp.]
MSHAPRTHPTPGDADQRALESARFRQRLKSYLSGLGIGLVLCSLLLYAKYRASVAQRAGQPAPAPGQPPAFIPQEHTLPSRP